MSLAERLAQSGRPDRMAEVRTRVQASLVESLGPKLYDLSLTENELRELVHQHLRELLDEEEITLSVQEKAQVIQQIGDSILGLGPLEPYVRDPAPPGGARCNRNHPATGARWPMPHRAQVLGRAVRCQRPDLLRHGDPTGRRARGGVCPRPAEHPGLRGYGSRKDHDAERVVVLPPRRRADPDDRGCGGASAPAAPCGSARVPASEHRGPG